MKPSFFQHYGVRALDGLLQAADRVMERLGSGSVLLKLRALLIHGQWEQTLWLGFSIILANYFVSLFYYSTTVMLLVNIAAVGALWFARLIRRFSFAETSVFRFLQTQNVAQLVLLTLMALGVGVIFTRLDIAAEALIILIFLGLAMIRPVYGLYAFALALPLLTYRPLLAFVLIMYLSLFIARPDFTIVRERLRNKLNIAALLFIIALFLTAVLSVGWMESMEQFVLYFFISFALYILIVALLDREALLQFLSLLTISGAAIALYGIFQNFTLGFTTAKWIDVSENAGISVRVFATFGNPNIFGQYLIMIMPLTFILMFVRRSALWFIAYGIPFLIMGGALALTYSRGSWAAIAVALLLLAAWISRRLLVAGLVLGLASIPFLPDTIMTRLATFADPSADSSANYRFQMWDSAFSMIRDYWMTGIGYDESTFLKVYADYMMPGVTVYHFHNIYLMALVTGGIVLFAALIYMFYQAIKVSVIGLFQNSGRSLATSLMLKGAAMAFIAIAIAGLTEDVWRNYRVDFMFWVVLAIISAAFNTSRETGKE